MSVPSEVCPSDGYTVTYKTPTACGCMTQNPAPAQGRRAEEDSSDTDAEGGHSCREPVW